MSNADWKRIWEHKHVEGPSVGPGDEDATIERLLALDGYTAETARVAPGDWRFYVRAIASKIDVRPGDRLFEVGCGSGAFLYLFHRMGCVTDGVDYSAALVGEARAVLQGGRFEVADAADIDPREAYDFVVSNGVFQYFSDLDYAGRVLSAMTEKARRCVCLLDVTDAARQEEGLRVRRGSFTPGEYERRFAGLEHLYYPSAWFEDFARKRGLGCIVEPQFMPNYVGRSFRFNVYLRKG